MWPSPLRVVVNPHKSSASLRKGHNTSRKRLANLLGGLTEPELKRSILADHFGRTSLGDATRLLQELISTPSRDELLLFATFVLAGPSSRAPVREAIVNEAKRLGFEDLAFFLQPRMPNLPERARLPSPYQSGRPLTLGERKSLARSQDRTLLTRILRDPHASVIQNVLTNPRIPHRDVVLLAAHTPTSPDVVGQVLANLRWALRYEVRLALIQNAFMPEGLAVPLTSLLRQADARKIARAGSLRAPIREGAKRVFQQR